MARPFSAILAFASRSRHRLDIDCRHVSAQGWQRKKKLELKNERVIQAGEGRGGGGDGDGTAAEAPWKMIDPRRAPPLPKSIEPRHMAAVEAYVAGEWLRKFPAGARTNRLRRDLAFRLKKGGPSPKKKLSPEVVKAIAGELARRDVVQLREKANNPDVWMIMAPAPAAPDDADRPTEEKE